MRVEPVEIYSDASNGAVMRHPGRRFPGVLMQGDTLNALAHQMSHVCALAGSSGPSELLDEAQDLMEVLSGLLTHYKSVLKDHEIALPFAD